MRCPGSVQATHLGELGRGSAGQSDRDITRAQDLADVSAVMQIDGRHYTVFPARSGVSRDLGGVVHDKVRLCRPGNAGARHELAHEYPKDLEAWHSLFSPTCTCCWRWFPLHCYVWKA